MTKLGSSLIYLLLLLKITILSTNLQQRLEVHQLDSNLTPLTSKIETNSTNSVPLTT